MANEINMQAVLTVTRTGLCLQGSATKDVDQAAGSNCTSNIQSITNSTTTGTTIGLGGISFPNSRGYIFVKNTDATNYVELSVVNTDQTAFELSVFAKLMPGEFCLVPMKTSKTYYARANTAAVVLQVAVAAT